MIINLFNGAGALAGPIVGSYMVSKFSTNKILYSWSIMAGFIILSTFYFLYSFRDFNDGILIGKVGDENTVLDIKEIQERVREEQAQDAEIENQNENERPSITLDIGQETNTQDDIVGGDDSFVEANKKTFNRTNKQMNTSTINLTKLEALKVTQVMNISKVGYEQDLNIETSPFKIFMKEQLIRDLINGQSIFWAIKVMDWLLIPIWASIKKEDMGLGFSNIQVGEITFYSFPGVLLIMLLGYGMLNISQQDWTIYSYVVFGVAVLATPLIGMFNLSESLTLCWLVIFECVKVSCYLIYSSAWGVLMNGYINSSILGRMYSFSFVFSHFSLILLFQMFPRLLSFMMSNTLMRKMGGVSVWLVFIVMALPSYYGVIITMRAKKLINEREGKTSEGSDDKTSYDDQRVTELQQKL